MMPQLRRVCTPLGEISYTLTRKKVKNLNLRITGGEVRLSAGPRVPLAHCDQMVAERAGWIQSSLARQQSRESRFFLPNCPAEGDVILFLGESVALHLWDGAAALRGDSLFLPSENPRKALDDFLAAQCRAVILPLCREVEALSPTFLAPTPPVVSFRRMTHAGAAVPLKSGGLPSAPGSSTCPYWPSKGWSSTSTPTWRCPTTLPGFTTWSGS